MKFEFIEDSLHEGVQPAGDLDAVGGARGGEGVGAEEGLEKERVLGHVAAECGAGERSIGETAHEARVETGLREAGVPGPERLVERFRHVSRSPR